MKGFARHCSLVSGKVINSVVSDFANNEPMFLGIPILLNFIVQMEKKIVGSYTTCVMFWVHL